MALPTFFIIGAPKAGTTSLHHYLSAHPEVQMSAIKEPRFFSGPDNGFPYPPDKVETLAEYESLFDPAFAVRGESSTDYATHPRREGVAARIKEAVPEARFVYLVRDPIDRAISHYKMATALLDERRPIESALGEALAEPRSRYLAPSRYATQIELYLEHFESDDLLVVDQVDLQARRAETLAEVLSFLGVEPTLDPEAFAEEKLGGGSWRAYPKGYTRFVNRVVTPRVRWLPAGLRRRARRGLERALWRPIETDLDERLRSRLEAELAPEVARLRELTGKRFATWSL